MEVKLIPTKHFIERLKQRRFDLSVIAQVLEEGFKHQGVFEVTTGNSTVVAERKDNTIRLITGWVGNRRKRKWR